MACAEGDLPVGEFSPSQIKLAVVGAGSADKEQVQYMVRQLLALEAVPSPDHAADALAAAIWLGVVPATLALALGALLRRWVGTQPFVYVLGRAFLGTVACVFAAGVLSQWTGHLLPGVGNELSLVARWLMAWGDGFVTGMLAAIFVAFKPEWLATWSDQLYLKRPPQ